MSRTTDREDDSEARREASRRAEKRPPVVIRPSGPFDLRLSLEADASFFPAAGPPPTILRIPVEVAGRAAIVEVLQPSDGRSKASGLVRASSVPAIASNQLETIVKWSISADLDLRPFYARVAPHPFMGAVALSLRGLKPLRPATLFEMAVIAITEQQLSLAAAFHIRARLVRRFGAPIEDLWVFPSPEKIAAAALNELAACGLSRRKAAYVKSLATRIAGGGLDLEALRGESDQRVRDVLLTNPGFGEWSAERILGHGLGRLDSLPSGDTGLRRVAGQYFAGGRRLAAAELEQALAPFRPFRGLAAFYLAVHWRLRRRAGQ